MSGELLPGPVQQQAFGCMYFVFMVPNTVTDLLEGPILDSGQVLLELPYRRP